MTSCHDIISTIMTKHDKAYQNTTLVYNLNYIKKIYKKNTNKFGIVKINSYICINN